MSWTEMFHRFRLGSEKPHAEREQVRVDVLAQLRTHPGFAALLDVYDAEIVTLFESFIQTDPKEFAAIRDLHAQARAIYRMVRLMDQTMTARDEAAKQELARMLQANRVDKEARKAEMAAAIAERAKHRTTVLNGRGQEG